ncbi:ArdC-like ssDNA-binding domain-containing protein [Bacillus sp. NRRL B-14911]|uniref:ArdC-like ssDNA-binding domain-containing protein n=1 Tax=Bacillus sp. NRRL B-14911 TaxID=313627 RepID=UPI0012F92CC6|nr:ArdC-like ssDNA-binding domain-containing protein [Bacillus sp. NRRL B-14911]
MGKGVRKMTKAAFKRRTVDEKKEQVEKLIQSLDEGVKNFTYNPGRFKALLEMQALMPKYTFRNIMLARIQLPEAQFIASFNRWKELGRNVKKGERSLRILAPRFKKVKDEITGEEETKLIGFLGVPVFDVSQTEGDPLPADRIKLTLDGESQEAVDIFEWVKELAKEDDCPVTIKHADGANGYYSITNHAIVVDSKLSINHRAKTGVHELVHSRVHRNINGTTATERECVAEGVAFIVCSYFGLDTSDYSFEYVNGWSKDGGESLMKYGDIMQKTANLLIEDFERVAEKSQAQAAGEGEKNDSPISA